jgi:hypothetical protein
VESARRASPEAELVSSEAQPVVSVTPGASNEQLNPERPSRSLGDVRARI